jgi:elongation factor P--(R)-beta-lysine ligase
LKTDLIWPARTRRNALIKEVIDGFEHGEGMGSVGIGGDLQAVGGDVAEGVWIAGRIIGILDGGFVLQDESGRMDVFHKGEDSRGEAGISGDALAGDIIEARVTAEKKVGEDGTVFNVMTVAELCVLAKCNDEYFIKKSDPNWKKSVVDLKLKEGLRVRTEVIKKTREFFWSRGFTETETPEMVKLPGMEPYLDPFKSRLKTQAYEGLSAEEFDTYLITSPEYAMKKLLVAGWEKIFQISKSFRNRETAGSLHNPEFTLLEWYRAYDDYRGIMKDTEELVNHLAKEICGSEKLAFGNYLIDMSLPWPRKKVADLFEEYAGIDGETLPDRGRLFAAVAAKGYKPANDAPYEDLFYTVFMNEIEPKLGLLKPLMVFDYPVQMAALAKKSAEDPRYAERFELYIGGVELCNAFTELNDPVEQEERLKEERDYRKKLGKENYPVDQSFIGALKFGMPPSGGNALGMDRLAMVLTDTPDIREMILFPLKDL